MSSLGGGVPLKLLLKGSRPRADVAYCSGVRRASVLLVESVSVHVRLPVPAVSPWNLLTAIAALQEEVFQADRHSCVVHLPSASARFTFSCVLPEVTSFCWSPLMHSSSHSLTLQKALQPLLFSPNRWTSPVHGQEPACKFIFIPKLLFAIPSPLRSQTKHRFEPAAVLYQWPGLLTSVCTWFLLCFFSKCYCLWPSLSARIILILL